MKEKMIGMIEDPLIQDKVSLKPVPKKTFLELAKEKGLQPYNELTGRVQTWKFTDKDTELANSNNEGMNLNKPKSELANNKKASNSKMNEHNPELKESENVLEKVILVDEDSETPKILRQAVTAKPIPTKNSKPQNKQVEVVWIDDSDTETIPHTQLLASQPKKKVDPKPKKSIIHEMRKETLLSAAAQRQEEIYRHQATWVIANTSYSQLAQDDVSSSK